MPTLADRWTRAVPAIRDVALRAALLRSEFVRAAVDDVAVALNGLCARAEQADPVAREVLAAAIAVIVDPEMAALVDELRQHAAEHAELPLGRLLRKKHRAPPQAAPPEPDERQLATSATGRPLTLGERKALARMPSRAALEKLLKDPHPLVIRNLLHNPRVTEDDIVRLAARRPAYPDVIVEIARSPHWMGRARVRMAIIQNPSSPPDIAVALVSLLIRPELSQVVEAVDVQPIVRAAATELLHRRPPVPERDDFRPPRQ